MRGGSFAGSSKPPRLLRDGIAVAIPRRAVDVWVNNPPSEDALTAHPDLFKHSRRGRVLHVAHGPHPVHVRSAQRPFDHRTRGLGHVAPPPEGSREDVSDLRSFALRPEV